MYIVSLGRIVSLAHQKSHTEMTVADSTYEVNNTSTFFVRKLWFFIVFWICVIFLTCFFYRFCTKMSHKMYLQHVVCR